MSDLPEEADVLEAQIEMERREGVGISANQMGKDGRWCIVRNIVMVNPSVFKKEGNPFQSLEGCLSLKGNYWVKRYPKVTVGWTDMAGKRHITTFSDDMATIVQHEIDHLDGIMIDKGIRVNK